MLFVFALIIVSDRLCAKSFRSLVLRSFVDVTEKRAPSCVVLTGSVAACQESHGFVHGELLPMYFSSSVVGKSE